MRKSGRLTENADGSPGNDGGHGSRLCVAHDAAGGGERGERVRGGIESRLEDDVSCQFSPDAAASRELYTHHCWWKMLRALEATNFYL